jgi:mono/diheme cytochrome c family protein
LAAFAQQGTIASRRYNDSSSALTDQEAAMSKPWLIVSAALLLATFSGAQQTKPTPKTAYHPVPVAAAREPNPVKPTPESLESGKKIYSYDCIGCHGATGDGKTNVAKDLKLPDFTDPAALKDRSDGELFYIIKNGRGDMPPEGRRVETNQLWDLVNYVRALAKKKASPEEKPVN